MKAEILTIGDELLIGQVINTNAAFIGEQLTLAGATVARTVVTGDDLPAIRQDLQRAIEDVDLVVITGGLGPTHDDVTRDALTSVFNVGLRFDESVYEAIKARFARRNRPMSEANRVQAMVPEGFEVLPNPVGTAPGLWHTFDWQGQPRALIVMPGVPHEMRYFVEHELLPRLKASGLLKVIGYRTLLTTGIGESDLQDRIGDLSDWLSPTLRLAYLPTSSGVRLRMTCYGENDREVCDRLDAFESRLRSRVESYLFGMNGDTLEGIVGKMLTERNLTLAVAESCTGGSLLNRLTNVSGSSAYVMGGVVAYNNEVKVRMLGVDSSALEREGAVSEIVARQMARGVRERLRTDIGVSTTGVAGPSGGTPDKPVGTVWMGYADENGDFAILRNLAEDRMLNKELSSTAVLNLVRQELQKRK